MNACAEARSWACSQPSAKAAWAACVRGDWMLWLLDAVLDDSDLLNLTWDDCSAIRRSTIDPEKARKQCADIIRKHYPKPPSLTRRKKQ